MVSHEPVVPLGRSPAERLAAGGAGAIEVPIPPQEVVAPDALDSFVLRKATSEVGQRPMCLHPCGPFGRRVLASTRKHVEHPVAVRKGAFGIFEVSYVLVGVERTDRAEPRTGTADGRRGRPVALSVGHGEPILGPALCRVS